MDMSEGPTERDGFIAAGAFKRILFCTDFSDNANFAFSFALDIAGKSRDSELHLLHIVPETEAQFWKSYMYEVENVDEKAKQDIDDFMERTYYSKVPKAQTFIVEHRVGNVSQEILDYARKKRTDLIIIGREGQSSLGTALFGKITEKISRHADCAVLIIPLSYQRRFQKV